MKIYISKYTQKKWNLKTIWFACFAVFLAWVTIAKAYSICRPDTYMIKIKFLFKKFSCFMKPRWWRKWSAHLEYYLRHFSYTFLRHLDVGNWKLKSSLSELKLLKRIKVKLRVDKAWYHKMTQVGQSKWNYLVFRTLPGLTEFSKTKNTQFDNV